MGSFATVRPRDDNAAEQASNWCDRLIREFVAQGHDQNGDIDDKTPADSTQIVSVLGNNVDLICYFGHGDGDSWLTEDSTTIDATNIQAAKGKAVVSVACKTGCNLGPAAVTAGVTAWLGFTIRIHVPVPHKNHDPIGEAIADGLACLATGSTMQQARDRIAANCAGLISDYEVGALSQYPGAAVGYLSAMALSEHVVLHGTTALQPFS